MGLKMEELIHIRNSVLPMIYLRRELFILRCYLSLLKRNFRKYFTVASFTYFLGASGIYRSAKPTYFFCRFVDDVTDGDRELPKGYDSFQAFMDRMLQLLDHQGSKGLKGIELVLADALRKLDKTAAPQIIRTELKDFLQSMQVDYKRRTQQLLLSQQAIDQLYDQSFASVLHLAMLGFGTQLQRSDIQKLGVVQGKIYALQDLEEDLSKGIFNVPEELVKAAGLSEKALMANPSALMNHQAFVQWQHAELSTCHDYIEHLYALEAGKKAKKIISVLVDPLAEYVDKLSKKVKLPAYSVK